MATLSTVVKVGQVLDLFTTDEPEWGVSEVAAALGSPRSSAHAMLASLAEIGLLQWRPGGRYRVGWRVIELAEVHRRTLNLRAAASPVLEELVEDLGETCHLAVRDRDKALYLDKCLGTHNITVQGAAVGARLDPHCTAVGKVLMAFGDAAAREAVLKQPLRRYTAATLITREALEQDLRKVRTQGYGTDLGEAVNDMCCVAAPVYDELQTVVGAISLSSPVSRYQRHRQRYIDAVIDAAGQVTRALVDAALISQGDSVDYPLPEGPRPRQVNR